jgi:transcription-repair coupling factor (superfamily II helicase)
MYTGMLDRAIRELKGEELAEKVSTQFNLGIDLRIPAEYIPEENQRLRMYKRAAGVQSEIQLEDVAKELRDRYGAPPAPVRLLLAVSGLKLLCENLGVLSVDRKRDTATVKFAEEAQIDPERLAEFVVQSRGAQFSPGGVLKLNLKSTQPEAVIAQLSGLLRDLSEQPVR